MQYIITCPSCQQQLTVNPGWEGQQVNCPLCSAPFVMPSPPPVAVAVPISMPVVERIEPAPKPILWNPTAAANWSLFFGPVFGTALHYVNWVTLGESKKAEQASKWFMVSVCVLIFGTVAMTQASDSTLILSINIALLLGWYFISAREQIRYVKQQHGKEYGRRRWWKPLLGSFVILLILIDLTDSRVTLPTRIMQPNTAPKFYELTGEEALAAARKHIVGTWTYTGPNYISNQAVVGFIREEVIMWIKLEVHEDGTMLKYRAKPASDDWGKPMRATWTIKTDKYANTGERYYEFCPSANNLEESFHRFFLNHNGTLQFRLGSDFALTMTRGDTFPFSK
jgi:hypothetical protein